MSNVVKFPGQEEEPDTDNVVRFASKAEIEALEAKKQPKQSLSFWAWCAVVAQVLFKCLRYTAAFCLQLALVIPLSVIGGFRWLICFFSMMALIGTWFVSTTMNGKLSPSEIHNVNTVYLVGWGLFILATFAQPLANWIAEKRIAFRLFGLKGD